MLRLHPSPACAPLDLQRSGAKPEVQQGSAEQAKQHQATKITPKAQQNRTNVGQTLTYVIESIIE